MAARTFREEKKQQQQSCILFGVIFNVYTQMDNTERARETNLLA